MILRFFFGMLLGLVYEFLVVRYTQSVVKRNKICGAGTTLGMGMVNLLIIAKLAWDKSLDLAVGYVIGESLGSFLWI